MRDSKALIIKKIALAHPEAVFVGGVAEVIHGIKKSAKDIDVKLLNLENLEFINIVNVFNTNSVMSLSGNRAIGYLGETMIDIFIGDPEPDFIIKDGIKYASKRDFEKHFKRMIDLSERESIKNYYKQKLALLNE